MRRLFLCTIDMPRFRADTQSRGGCARRARHLVGRSRTLDRNHRPVGCIEGIEPHDIAAVAFAIFSAYCSKRLPRLGAENSQGVHARNRRMLNRREVADVDGPGFFFTSRRLLTI